jgi:tetratricopeptide (TPR) repeat protein
VATPRRGGRVAPSKRGWLLSGLDLANFSTWWEREAPNPAWAKRYGGLFGDVKQFLEESLAAESDRIARETARDRQDRRRLKIGLSVFVALTLVASAFGIIAQRSENRLHESNVDLARAAESRDRSLASAQSVLNAVTRTLGSDEHFARIGAEKLQRDLLKELQPHFAELAEMESAKGGMSRDEIDARYLLGRLTDRVQSTGDALPIYEQLFAELERQGAGRPLSDLEVLDRARIGSQLAGIYYDLSHEAEAREIAAKVLGLLPGIDNDLTALTAVKLEAYEWYLSFQAVHEPLTADNQFARATRKRWVDVCDRWLMLAGDSAAAHYRRYYAYAYWQRSLRQLGKRDEAAAAARIATEDAKAAYDRAPQNSTYLYAYAFSLTDQAEIMESEGIGTLADAQQLAQQATELLQPALVISPNSNGLLKVGSAASDRLGGLLQYRGDYDEALRRRLDAVAFVIRRMEADPLNRDVADDALSIFSSLRWILDQVHNDVQTRDRCLALAKETLSLAMRHPDVLQDLQLTTANLSCALTAEQDLAADTKTSGNLERSTDKFILENSEYFVTTFQNFKVDPDNDVDYQAEIAAIIERLELLAEENNDFFRAESYASEIIGVLGRMRPDLDYDQSLIEKISFAHRAIGDYRRRLEDFAEAARHYRICADPDLVAYPKTDCMQRLIEMIESGNLGPGHDDEARTLRARIPDYMTRTFTVKIYPSPGRPKIPVYIHVTAPPKGYEGVDNEVMWWSHTRRYGIPEDVVDCFRKIDKRAREEGIPLSALASEAVAEISTKVALEDINKDFNERDTPAAINNAVIRYREKAALEEITTTFDKGDAQAAMDKAVVLFGKGANSEDASAKLERQVAVISRIANGLVLLAAAYDAKPLETALARTRSLLASDMNGAAANPIQLAFAELLEKAASAYIRKDAYEPARALLEEANTVRREAVDGGAGNASARANILDMLGLLAYKEKDYTRAKNLLAEAVVAIRQLLQEPTDKQLRVALGKVLRHLAEAEAAADGAARALANITEAVEILRGGVYVVSARSSSQQNAYLDALESFGSIASDAGAHDRALFAAQEDVDLLRGLVASDEKQKPRFVHALGEVSYYALFMRQWTVARAAAEEALALDPSQIWIETNAAHARMFAGETAAARDLYLVNRGKDVNDLGKWEDVVLDDFNRLRQAGLDDPLMAEIETAFATAHQRWLLRRIDQQVSDGRIPKPCAADASLPANAAVGAARECWDKRPGSLTDQSDAPRPPPKLSARCNRRR